MRTPPSNPRPTRRTGGRPSKGYRFSVTTKLPRSYEQKLHARVDYRGETVTDYVASLILADLDANEVPESNGQEAFDVKIA